MLEHKGIGYRRVDITTGMHPAAVRLRGFPGHRVRELGGDKRPPSLVFADRMGTVPALKIADQRIQTNREIARLLEEVEPQPPLFPADPALRREVEAAELWGSDDFQMVARRLGLAAVLHGPDALYDRAHDGRLGPLLYRNDRVRFIGTRMIGRLTFATTLDSEARLLAGLPPMLDRIDAWIEAGVLNSDQLNVADFMIAPSLALLSYRRDLGPGIESRPAGALVERLLPAP
jgi:glutathione S-transferase